MPHCDKQHIDNHAKLNLKLMLRMLKICSKAKLLYGILSSSNLCSKDAQNRDHSHAPIADLLGPHVVVVHIDAKRVAVVPSLPVILLPPGELHDAACEHEQKHTEKA